MNQLVLTCCYWALVATTVSAQNATLKMRFVLDGDPPPVKQFMVGPPVAPPAGPFMDERLLVEPKSRGIKNVILYVDTRHGSKIEVPQQKKQNRTLTMTNARFDPHVLIARAGDMLELVERGPNQHNPILSFVANDERQVLVPRGQSHPIPDLKAEPVPIPVACGIHPWMKAVVVILDHSFVAISDADGNVTIDDLPANTTLRFKVFHEAGLIDRVRIQDQLTNWSRSRFEIDLTEGVNDLGDILVPSKSLTP